MQPGGTKLHQFQPIHVFFSYVFFPPHFTRKMQLQKHLVC